MTNSIHYQNKPESTRALLLGIWTHLSHRRRVQLGLLLIMMLASGVAELVSLGAVLPFLAVLSNLDCTKTTGAVTCYTIWFIQVLVAASTLMFVVAVCWLL